MNQARVILLALACLAAPVALAQWQWIDKDGRKVFSDQPPPAGTPPSKIVKQPGNRPVEPDAAPVPAPAAPAAMPKVSGKDKELEDKRKQASAVEAEKKRAAEEEGVKLKADNCSRAKQAKATLDSGIRLTVVNAQGEREVMDDNARAGEARRLDGVISRNCT